MRLRVMVPVGALVIAAVGVLSAQPATAAAKPWADSAELAPYDIGGSGDNYLTSTAAGWTMKMKSYSSEVEAAGRAHLELTYREPETVRLGSTSLPLAKIAEATGWSIVAGTEVTPATPLDQPAEVTVENAAIKFVAPSPACDESGSKAINLDGEAESVIALRNANDGSRYLAQVELYFQPVEGGQDVCFIEQYGGGAAGAPMDDIPTGATAMAGIDVSESAEAQEPTSNGPAEVALVHSIVPPPSALDTIAGLLVALVVLASVGLVLSIVALALLVARQHPQLFRLPHVQIQHRTADTEDS